MNEVLFCKGCSYSQFKEGVKADDDGTICVSCNNTIGMFAGLRMNFETGQCNWSSVKQEDVES